MLLKRSKSQKAERLSPDSDDLNPFPSATTPGQDDPPWAPLRTPTATQGEETSKQDKRKSRSQRRTSVFGRSKSADARRSIDRRPPAATTIFEDQDDFQPAMPIMIDIYADGDTFSFPTPSPRLPPKGYQPLRSNPVTRSPQIGVAIGSPSQTPTWTRSYTADDVSDRMPRRTAQVKPDASMTRIPEIHVVEDPPRPEVRRKKSGWKTFGGLFQKKQTRSTASEPLDGAQTSVSETARPPRDEPSHVSHKPHSPSISQHHQHSPSLTRGIARAEARAEADRQSLMHNMERQKHRQNPGHQHGNKLGTSTSRSLDPVTESPKIHGTTSGYEASVTAGAANSTSLPIPRTPRLDLDIPNGELERYSVMFGKLLEPRQSILERRQSKAKRNKPNEDVAAVTAAIHAAASGPTPIDIRLTSSALHPPGLQRSATSPHLRPNPSLRIDVFGEGSEAKHHQSSIHRPRPIQRSKTAPSSSVSPVARNFSRPQIAAIGGSGGSHSHDASTVDDLSIPATPSTLQSPTDVGEGDADGRVAILTEPLRPRGGGTDGTTGTNEPSWDMLTSQATYLSPTPTRDGKPLYPRARSPKELERQLVQVSVARQVSVNKARRQVQKAVESKQPLRPRVVELQKSGQRKSTHVVLIDGREG